MTVQGNRQLLGVAKSALWHFTPSTDERGTLVPIEFSETLPFVPKRLFFVSNVPQSGSRGDHAHRECEQLLFAARGRVSVLLDDGAQSAEVRLDHPSKGLFIPSGVWAKQRQFTADAVLVVLASLPYDPDDYIDDYDEYLRLSAQ